MTTLTLIDERTVGQPWFELMDVDEASSSRTIRFVGSVRPTNLPQDLFLRDALAAIVELQGLDENWDSYGASRISSRAAGKAREVLGLIYDEFLGRTGVGVEPYAIVPLSDGGIQLEWHSLRGDIEVQVTAAGGLGYLVVLGQGPRRVFRERNNVRIADVIEGFKEIASP